MSLKLGTNYCKLTFCVIKYNRKENEMKVIFSYINAAINLCRCFILIDETGVYNSLDYLEFLTKFVKLNFGVFIFIF